MGQWTGAGKVHRGRLTLLVLACRIRDMQTLLEVAVYDVTVPAVIGLSALALLLVGLGWVRQIGKGRPHS